MATKTWKIGEYCVGGVITVETTGNKVSVICKDWDMSAGTNKNSNQSNAKELRRITVDFTNNGSERTVSEFLYDLTTSYYTDLIMDWIKSKVKINRQLFW